MTAREHIESAATEINEAIHNALNRLEEQTGLAPTDIEIEVKRMLEPSMPMYRFVTVVHVRLRF